MPAVTAIAGVMTSIKTMKDLAEAMVAARDTAAFQEKQIALQAVALEAQQAVFAVNEERTALLDRIGELEGELACMKDWEEEKKRYQLKRVSSRGTFAYAVKPEMQGVEPAHYLCANCYQTGKKSLLQALPELVLGQRQQACPACGSAIVVEGKV